MAVCDEYTEYCAKGDRAAAYCRRDPCIRPGALARMASATTVLPPPDVAVDVSTPAGSTATQVDVRVSRDGTGAPRVYTGVGSTPQGAVKDVIEKILGDPGAAEYLR